MRGTAVLSLLVGLASSGAAACVKAELLATAADGDPRTALEAIDRDCATGLQLLADGRAAEAYVLLLRVMEHPEVLDKSLALPLAEAMIGAGAPVDATLAAWESVTAPAPLVLARRFELVERLPAGQAAALLKEEPGRASAKLLEERAHRDADQPALVPTAVTPGRIGVLLPLSGRLAPLGRRLLAGMRLGLDDKTTLVLRDTGEGGLRVRGLIDELALLGVIAIIGPVDRGVSAAAAEAAEARHVPLLRLTVEDEELVRRKWVFRAFLSRRSQARALVSAAHASGLKRFAILHTESGFGTALARDFTAAVAEAGGTLVDTVSYPAAATSLTAEARRLRQRPFEALFIADTADRATLLLRFLAREDIWSRGRRKVTASGRVPKDGVRYVQVFGPSEWRVPSVFADGGRYVDGTMVAAEWPGVGDKDVAPFVTAAREGLDAEPGVFEAAGYDVVRMLAAAHGATRRAVADGLRAKKGFAGVLGHVRFDDAGEPTRTVRLYRATDKVFERIK